MPDAVRDNNRVRLAFGVVKGIHLGGMTGLYGNPSMGRSLAMGVAQDNVEGSPAPPALRVAEPGNWRFRWSVKTGANYISINVKQQNVGTRPALIVKADASLGIASDVVGVASASDLWVTIGPLTVTASAAGMVWVEVWNRCTETIGKPAYFDHLVTR